MQGNRTIMQAGMHDEEGISIILASTVLEDSRAVAELWINTEDSPDTLKVQLRQDDSCEIRTDHRVTVKDIVASTRQRKGYVVLEFEEIGEKVGSYV